MQKPAAHKAISAEQRVLLGRNILGCISRFIFETVGNVEGLVRYYTHAL